MFRVATAGRKNYLSLFEVILCGCSLMLTSKNILCNSFISSFDAVGGQSSPTALVCRSLEKISVYHRVFPGKTANKFFHCNPLCLILRRAWISRWVISKSFYCTFDFRFLEIHQWPNHCNSCTIQVCHGTKDMNLPGVEDTHKKRFHCVIPMMSKSNLIEALFYSKTVQ